MSNVACCHGISRDFFVDGLWFSYTNADCNAFALTNDCSQPNSYAESNGFPCSYFDLDSDANKNAESNRDTGHALRDCGKGCLRWYLARHNEPR